MVTKTLCRFIKRKMIVNCSSELLLVQALVDDANACRRKMNMATALIDGLSGEKIRWTAASKGFEAQINRLVGDVLLATGFLSYAGPFNQEFRKQLMKNWKREMTQNHIPFSEVLAASFFLWVVVANYTSVININFNKMIDKYQISVKPIIRTNSKHLFVWTKLRPHFARKIDTMVGWCAWNTVAWSVRCIWFVPTYPGPLPTHHRGHTLDLVMTADTTSLSGLDLREMDHLSDHKYIYFDLPYQHVHKDTSTVITRNWTKFDIANFKQELATSELATTLSDDVNHLFNLYNTTMAFLLDKHAYNAWWFVNDRECQNARREVRRLERIHRRHWFPLCNRKWRPAVVHYHQFLGYKQQSFWSGRIHDSACDSRTLWKALSGLMDPPSTQSTSITPAAFASYFKGKVDARYPCFNCRCFTVHDRILLQFYSEYVHEYNCRGYRWCPNKQCTLDPAPTWLIKAISATTSPIIAKLVNASLHSATFPSSVKYAIVKPIIKSLD